MTLLNRIDTVDVIIVIGVSTIVIVGVLNIVMPKPTVTWSPITSPVPSLSCFSKDGPGNAVVCVDNDAE